MLVNFNCTNKHYGQRQVREGRLERKLTDRQTDTTYREKDMHCADMCPQIAYRFVQATYMSSHCHIQQPDSELSFSFTTHNQLLSLILFCCHHCVVCIILFWFSLVSVQSSPFESTRLKINLIQHNLVGLQKKTRQVQVLVLVCPHHCGHKCPIHSSTHPIYLVVVTTLLQFYLSHDSNNIKREGMVFYTLLSENFQPVFNLPLQLFSGHMTHLSLFCVL